MTDTRETVLAVTGMGCSSCVGHVGEALRGVAGVEEVSVDLDAGRARVRHDGTCATDALVAAVEGAGYGASAA
ncbi:MAG: heavy-metal-associated domain-containing protein [Myxococcales bacterium]|nr:heavy-metal-associated domain-containing protein [Myxococcales bacterium]